MLVTFGISVGVTASCTDPLGDAAGLPVPAGASKSQASGSLAPGDVISVVFPGASELNLSQKIRADGRVSLPMIGDVSAAGRSLPSFQAYLSGRYKEHLQESTVMVSLVQAAAGVYVTGAINSPQRVILDRPMTVLEAVMECGGFSGAANPKKVSVVRIVDGNHKRYNLNLSDAMLGKTTAFYVQPYDVIYVSQRTW